MTKAAAAAAAAATGLPPVPLHAMSYDLGQLLKESAAIDALKTPDGQLNRLANVADKLTTSQDVLKGRNEPVAPEGHVIDTIEDAQGNQVLAPVIVVDDATRGTDAATTN